MLQEHLPPMRGRLKDVYLSQQNYIRPQVIGIAISPPPDLSAPLTHLTSGQDPKTVGERKAVVPTNRSNGSMPGRQGAL